MAQLGPAMAFETLGKILLVGLCGLTHYKRLELLATLAVTTVIVDFLIFMRYGQIHKTADADHDQATNGFGSKILKVFKLSGYLQ